MRKEELVGTEQKGEAGSSRPGPGDGPGLALVRIRRYDPSTGQEPFYQEFKGIPFEARSVMEVLYAIYEEIDPSLAFRRPCARGFCGSCFLLVNGEPALACQYPAQAEMTIEPHPKFPVIRDLVVDLDHPAGGHWERVALSGGSAKAQSQSEG